MNTNRIADFLAAHPFEPCFLWPGDPSSDNPACWHDDLVAAHSLCKMNTNTYHPHVAHHVLPELKPLL